jgi:hypothetical protein
MAKTLTRTTPDPLFGLLAASHIETITLYTLNCNLGYYKTHYNSYDQWREPTLSQKQLQRLNMYI